MRERTEELKAHRPGRTAVHPYKEWFDAGLKAANGIDLLKGEDFDSEVATMRHNLYRTGKKEGLSLTTITLRDEKDNEIGIGLKVFRPDSKSNSTDSSNNKQNK